VFVLVGAEVVLVILDDVTEFLARLSNIIVLDDVKLSSLRLSSIRARSVSNWSMSS
jgi:hypothetical protein